MMQHLEAQDHAPPASWFANFGQISFGTSDLARSIRFWEQQLDIGPWTIFRGLTMDALHEGARIHMPFDVALAWHDGRLVELIQAIGDGPSPLHDGFNRATIGIQRLASLTDDIERDARLAEQRGMQVLTQGDAGGQRFIHYRSAEAPGVILELLERTPAFDRLCDQLRRRAARYCAAQPRPRAATSSPQAVAGGTTMRAALLDGYGGPERFRIADVPTPQPGRTQVRIRVAAAAINPADVKARRGLLSDFVSLAFPARLGGDISGVVDAVGEGVSRWSIGDRVAGMINPFADGAYAEFVVADEAALVSVPAGVDLVNAAALPTGVLTGLQLVESGIQPKAGDRVLVTGAGGSAGRAAVLGLIEAGAIPVAGVRSSSRDNLADLPVKTVDLSDLTALSAAGPFEAIADTVGGGVLDACLPLVRSRGTVASVAVPVPTLGENSDARFSAIIVRFDAPRLTRFLAGVASGHWTMPVARRLGLEEVSLGHELVEAGGTAGKVLLCP